MGDSQPPRRFLLQLAGVPGSGKSQLATAISGQRPAVIVSSDVVKSTLLNAGVEWKVAGPAAYQTLFALADHLLVQGHSVILDSPSHYPYIPELGARIAVSRLPAGAECGPLRSSARHHAPVCHRRSGTSVRAEARLAAG